MLLKNEIKFRTKKSLTECLESKLTNIFILQVGNPDWKSVDVNSIPIILSFHLWLDFIKFSLLLHFPQIGEWPHDQNEVQLLQSVSQPKFLDNTKKHVPGGKFNHHKPVWTSWILLCVVQKFEIEFDFFSIFVLTEHTCNNLTLFRLT